MQGRAPNGLFLAAATASGVEEAGGARFKAGPAAAGRGPALFVIVLGVVMAAVDTTIVVLALPDIQRSLHSGLADVVWVVISYLLVVTVLSTQVGRLGDLFGRVRLYRAGFLVFIAGSALCALAFNDASLIGFRVIQGIGGALLAANSSAVIADTFPSSSRGFAYGFTAVGWNVGAIAGILLGGVIIDYLSWRWVFWINLPAGGLAYLLSLRVLRERSNRRAHSIDFVGMTLLGTGLFGVLWAMTRIATQAATPSTWVLLSGGLVLLVVFLLVEARSREPMLDLRIFRVPTLAPTLCASFFQALGNFAVLFLVIMYLQGVRGESPLTSSLLLVPGYLLGAVMAPIAGRISDRIGPVAPATLGLAIQVAALVVYLQLTTRTPLWVVVVASVVSGLGSGNFFPANNAALMKASPPEHFGVVSGVGRTFQNIGMVFSFAVAVMIAGLAIPRRLAFAIFIGTKELGPPLAAAFTKGMSSAFLASIGFLALAAVLSASRLAAWRTRTGAPAKKAGRAV
jgi:EmrB/QacA subfamily drug resistance transporter